MKVFGKEFKVFCRGNHWAVVGGQVHLGTPFGKDKERARKLIQAIRDSERHIVYEEICAMRFTQSKKTIVRNGIENTALTVQDMIARSILPKEYDHRVPKKATNEGQDATIKEASESNP